MSQRPSEVVVVVTVYTGTIPNIELATRASVVDVGDVQTSAGRRSAISGAAIAVAGEAWDGLEKEIASDG